MLRSLFLTLLLAPPGLAACPDLTPYYPGGNADWETVHTELQGLFNECLQDSEYFALLGAAELNSGRTSDALDSLERALLLNPDNGAAQIDYAQALLSDGQLFAALEVNDQTLAREDLPADLAAQLGERRRRWRGLTRQTEWQLDTLAGYDNNLNGAPDSDVLTLTLSGEPILLTLSPEFQAVSGPFLNLRGIGRHRQLTPRGQHNVTAEVRARASEDEASDLLQFSTRYALIRPDPAHSWQAGGAINHLYFGGSALFTGTEINGRYQLANRAGCSPYLLGAAQHQIWHGQSRLNGVEAKAGLGSNCGIAQANPQQRLSAELNLLSNIAIRAGRPGGDRHGWQAGLVWQAPLGAGSFLAQFAHTQLLDRLGYSPLLAGGARRRVTRDSLLLSYREPIPALGDNATFVINAFHQSQRSNLELFDTSDSTIELGFSWRF